MQCVAIQYMSYYKLECVHREWLVSAGGGGGTCSWHDIINYRIPAVRFRFIDF